MTTRFLVGCVLALAACSVLQIALDGAGCRALDQQQWRAPTHHQGTARLPRRNTSGIPAAALPSAVVGLHGPVTPADCPDVFSPLLASVFVPPRV